MLFPVDSTAEAEAQLRIHLDLVESTFVERAVLLFYHYFSLYIYLARSCRTSLHHLSIHI